MVDEKEGERGYAGVLRHRNANSLNAIPFQSFFGTQKTYAYPC